MTHDDPLFVDCEPHGRRIACVVCSHLLQSEAPVGFIENSDDPNDLQAWCEQCEALFLTEGDRTEAFNKFHGMGIVCDICYRDLRTKHNRE